MGRRSTKENKNYYQILREENKMTRSDASRAMVFMSESRIEKIESEKCEPQPDEIMAMAKAYRKPSLCNYYCSQKCPIGIQQIPVVKESHLSQIVLGMLAALNALERQKERLIEIAADGDISEDEALDFENIQKQLNQISLAVQELQLWQENKKNEGS